MKILIAGDFCQRYRVDEAVKQKKYGESFKEVRPVISQADYSIINFEFPIVLDSKEAKPINKCGPNLKGTIEAIDALKYAGFDCCTLANNHILDQGEQCCLDTRAELEKAGMDTIGAGRNLQEAGAILYKKIQGETLAIINCCEHEFTVASENTAGANPLNPVQQYYKIKEARNHADYILVIVHGGHEHYQLPSPRMQETYRFFIDAGADAVVNHHQHCYSGYEIYNGKPIFYGLGNLLFDHPRYRHSSWNKGFMVEIDFSMNEIDYDCIPYSQCNEDITINLMKGSEIDNFYKSIDHLNKIISNSRTLQDSANNYYGECFRSEINVMEPYSGKIAKKLYSLHLLPSWLKGMKVAQVLNHVDCESHRDKLVFFLTKLNQK